VQRGDVYALLASAIKDSGGDMVEAKKAAQKCVRLAEVEEMRQHCQQILNA
jgi:hypothetical protein